MKKMTLSLMTLLVAGFAFPAAASELMVAATMQRCTTNEDCMLVTNSCKDNCGFVPVNKSNSQVLQNQYQARCGKPMEANPTCNMNPPISAACVNARCTIGYAYQNNASAGDYQSGAYAVPEAPETNKVKGDYSKIDDRHGFTAYDLPQNEVRENTVGTIHSTVYVPPSAPVSGGNYVPVNGVAPTPSAPAPSVPPAAMPTDTTYATTPTDVVPAAPVYPAPEAAAIAPAAPATPELVPPVAPTYNAVPTMTPSVPNTPPPGVPEAATAPAVPASPYQYVAPETVVTAPQPPAPTPVPVAPPGSKPIPPSDLKPVESSIPSAGGTIPVNPEDPGAPPPAGTKVILKGSQMETVSTKAFGAKPQSEAKAAKVGSFN